MASNGDLDDMDYLSPSFDPTSLTIPKLRSIFVEHNISFPASAKKPDLIDIFTRELVPRSRKILAARERVRRTSKGITDMPSSQEGTVDGEQDDDIISMPPPPLPHATKRKSRQTSRTMVDEGDGGGRTSSSRKRSSKHARSSDTETDQRVDTQRSPRRRNRKSETTPTLKVEEPDDSATRPPMRSSVFSDENPFQSGSSPLVATEARRKSAVSGGDRRKSLSKRRKTAGVPKTEESTRKQEDGILVPSSKTFDIPSSRVLSTRIKQEPSDGLEAGEEFSPEETLELVRERARNGERDILPPRRKLPLKPSLVPKSAPWVILTSLLSGYALWFRQEKLAIGYCGVGRPSAALSNVQLPQWASFLQPTCEPCPPHAYCYERLETRCEKDFVLHPHPLSLSGIVPLPPTCEPDGEKVRRVKAVADRAVEELRDRNAQWECGTLLNEKGKSVPTAEIDTQELKSAVVRKRRKGMSEAEFEDLWNEAIGEIVTREDVTSNGRFLRSTSHARLPFFCAFRRSIRLTLARHRLGIILLLGLCSLLAYIHSYIRSLRSSKARVPALVATTLDRLATQAALNARGEVPEGWISVGQLRDDVLRDEFSASRRDKLWTKVAVVVERNANVRAAVREGRGGEVSRVWEWIGSVGMLGNGGRLSWGAASTPDAAGGGTSERSDEMVETRKWDEGRPLY